ncbi:MAG TPA: hypothetical protein VK466_16240, partial [Terriglobales bacterium]|nr:hypothetical protein [Terriglobales bacterium]
MLLNRLEFEGERDNELFSTLPARPAVFALRGATGSEPYISKTANLQRRMRRLLAPPEERSKRLNLREVVRTIEYTLVGSDFESGFLLYRILRGEYPKTYASRLRLRFAPMVKL